MYELKEKEVKIRSTKPNKEKNVPETAFYITCEYNANVNELNKLDERLISTFFESSSGGDLAEQAEGQSFHKKFEHLPSEFKWGWQGAGYTCVIDYGIGVSESITIDDCKVDNFSFSFEDKGIVKMVFRVRGYPSGNQRGAIEDFLSKSVTMSLLPPSVSDQQDAFSGEEQPIEEEGNFADFDDSVADAVPVTEPEEETKPGLTRCAKLGCDAVGVLRDEKGVLWCEEHYQQ